MFVCVCVRARACVCVCFGVIRNEAGKIGIELCVDYGEAMFMAVVTNVEHWQQAVEVGDVIVEINGKLYIYIYIYIYYIYF